MSDEFVRDAEGTVIDKGDLLVATSAGQLIRGRVLAPRLEGVFGGLLLQSLIMPSRTALIAPSQSMVIEKASLVEATRSKSA